MVYVIIGTIYGHGMGQISCEQHKALPYSQKNGYKTAQIIFADFSLATLSLHTINIVNIKPFITHSVPIHLVV